MTHMAFLSLFWRTRSRLRQHPIVLYWFRTYWTLSYRHVAHLCFLQLNVVTYWEEKPHLQSQESHLVSTFGPRFWESPITILGQDAVNCLFNIPQKLSKRTLSLPCNQRTATSMWPTTLPFKSTLNPSAGSSPSVVSSSCISEESG